jgi:hypothetical protein
MYTTTTTNSLTFVLEGTEQVLAFRAKVKVNRDDIESITWSDRFTDWPSLQVRMPGSYLPSWIMAGSYWNEDGWDFVLAKKPKGLVQPILFDVLVVKTKKTRYKRIIIRMEKDKAQEILSWWNDGEKSTKKNS